MKSIDKYILIAGLFAGVLSTTPAAAQYMPVVYDKNYGRAHQFEVMETDFTNGEAVAAGVSDSRASLTWLDRSGGSRLFKRFPGDEFERILALESVGDGQVLVMGYRHIPAGDKRSRATGHAMLMGSNGVVERDFYIGEPGTKIMAGQVLPDGHIILSGSTLNKEGREAGFVCKVSPRNKVVYFYTAVTGAVCRHFDVLGNRSELLHAAFTDGKGGSSVVRLDENGKPYFLTTLPDESYRIERMVSTADGDIYLVGQGEKAGGTVVKIRPEGDEVFNKPIVPASADTRLDQLGVLPTGELLVGGHDSKNSYFALLRSDGTVLISSPDRGEVSAIAQNIAGDHCVVSLYDRSASRGKIIKLSKEGRKLYEKNTAANYTNLRINGNDDLLMGNSATGRLSMLSATGETLFDRFAVENEPTTFSEVCLPMSGEAFFVGEGSRVTKLAHGIHVSDIIVNKPIDGYATATFTVTLSGFGFTDEGTPRPVTVNYKTTPVSAKEGLNFTPVTGTLSFIPSTDGRDRYLNRYTVEVPVMANDLLEGDRTFDLQLSDVTDSYLIRGKSLATIVDQPSVVRMISSTAGTEGESDVVYELGIFKTNGVRLTNATKADIVIDGIYGKGTADKMDFDMGRQPRLTITPGSHSGRFSVQTFEDTRYENIKTVVVDFNKIHAMSDTEVSFGSNVLSCEGLIYDQPALVAIESLGDYNKMNNVVSGFFKISLLRAKDGAVQTNCSGGDIFLQTQLDDKATAVQGTDFVFSNAHDLRIWGDDRSSAVNLNGMVLYTPDSIVKTVGVKLSGVRAAEGAGKIGIAPDKQSASFNILNR